MSRRKPDDRDYSSADVDLLWCGLLILALVVLFGILGR